MGREEKKDEEPICFPLMPQATCLTPGNLTALFLGISLPLLRSAQSPPLWGGSPVSEVLHLVIFHQPQGNRIFDVFPTQQKGREKSHGLSKKKTAGCVAYGPSKLIQVRV